MPPTIVAVSPVRPVYGNDPAGFAISFQSRFEANTQVRWLLNTRPLSQGVRVIYEADGTSATTSLQYSELQREDGGHYTVEITNNVTAIPVDRRTVRTSFNVIVVGRQLILYFRS